MRPEPVCTCGSGAHPRACKLHPELYRLHVAELNVEGYLPEDEPAAMKAMDELNAATQEALKKRGDAIERLTRLVFQANPNLKSYSLLKFWKKPQGGFGGATDYEVWLRSLDHTQLAKRWRVPFRCPAHANGHAGPHHESRRRDRFLFPARGPDFTPDRTGRDPCQRGDVRWGRLGVLQNQMEATRPPWTGDLSPSVWRLPWISST